MASASSNQLPPLSALRKNRDVEDPVNVYLHRPLAYLFVKSIFKTRVTPNQVTLFALLLGMGCGACWLWGSPSTMFWGGILLWASAIVDGADGILARAKKLDSPYGRAIDGTADALVAISSMVPALIHIFAGSGNLTYALLFIPTVWFAVQHLYLYDYYKESYLRFTQPTNNKDGEDLIDVETRLRQLEQTNGSALARFTVKYGVLPMMNSQLSLLRILNPLAVREEKSFVRNAATALIYRKHNHGPMRLWALISLAPHSYLVAICGMFDRLELYFWIRLGLMNIIFIIVAIWQRQATRATYAEWKTIGAEPVETPIENTDSVSSTA